MTDPCRVTDLAAALADSLDSDQVEALRRALSAFTPDRYDDADRGDSFARAVMDAGAALAGAPEMTGAEIERALDLAGNVLARRVRESRAMVQAHLGSRREQGSLEVQP